jgi:hypothetical protein
MGGADIESKCARETAGNCHTKPLNQLRNWALRCPPGWGMPNQAVRMITEFVFASPGSAFANCSGRHFLPVRRDDRDSILTADVHFSEMTLRPI